jgi:hypothetical protein
MTHRMPHNLNFGKKLLLNAASATLIAIANAPAVHSQSQSEHIAFEAASVKPNNSTDFRDLRLQFLPGGRLVFRNTPLLLIVATAYNVPFQSPRLTGGVIGNSWRPSGTTSKPRRKKARSLPDRPQTSGTKECG